MLLNDPGGLVGFHILLGKHLAAAGTKVVVVFCVSACLNLLAQLPKENVCFRPDAWIGFHSAAQRADGTEDTTTMRWERGRDWIAKGWKSC